MYNKTEMKKDQTYIILHDTGGVYEDDTKISANALIKDFIEGLNEKEDKDTIEWLTKAINEPNKDFAMAFIASAWEMEIQPIN